MKVVKVIPMHTIYIVHVYHYDENGQMNHYVFKGIWYIWPSVVCRPLHANAFAREAMACPVSRNAFLDMAQNLS